MDEAKLRNRKVGVLFIDLEGQYTLTITHGLELVNHYANHIDLYWVSLPLHLRNAVSVFQTDWFCWDPDKRDEWIRIPPQCAITDEDYFPFFRRGMEFEEFTPAFGHWYSQGELTACLVGIRSDESLNRYRTIASRKKSTFDRLQWTTWCGQSLFNAYPIYDWKTADIWTYFAKSGNPHNLLYDRMYQAGLTIHQMRICQPFGDDQRKGLYLYHVIEPDTWARLLTRVAGANQGALYAKESGDILGNLKITKPSGHTWKSFAHLVLDTLPPRTSEHYKNKIAVFLKWWADRGYPNGIPDYADVKDEASKKVPSWRRICKALLRNDYWCKGLSFSQHKSAAYEKHLKIMKKRRREWGIYAQ